MASPVLQLHSDLRVGRMRVEQAAAGSPDSTAQVSGAGAPHAPAPGVDAAGGGSEPSASAPLQAVTNLSQGAARGEDHLAGCTTAETTAATEDDAEEKDRGASVRDGTGPSAAPAPPPTTVSRHHDRGASVHVAGLSRSDHCCHRRRRCCCCCCCCWCFFFPFFFVGVGDHHQDELPLHVLCVWPLIFACSARHRINAYVCVCVCCCCLSTCVCALPL